MGTDFFTEHFGIDEGTAVETDVFPEMGEVNFDAGFKVFFSNRKANFGHIVYALVKQIRVIDLQIRKRDQPPIIAEFADETPAV
jgi:hypothetical protein